MIIPAGFGQANFLFGGISAPLGAAVTLAFSNDDGASALEVAENLGSMFAVRITPNLSSGITQTGCLVKLGPNATGPSAFEAFAALGTQAAAGLTPAVAYLVRKNTALGGREGRGRMFIPGGVESALDNSGNVISGTLAGLQAAFNNLFADMVAGFVPPVLLHNSATVPTDITSFSVDSRAATQRRRQRK